MRIELILESSDGALVIRAVMITQDDDTVIRQDFGTTPVVLSPQSPVAALSFTIPTISPRSGWVREEERRRDIFIVRGDDPSIKQILPPAAEAAVLPEIVRRVRRQI